MRYVIKNYKSLYGEKFELSYTLLFTQNNEKLCLLQNIQLLYGIKKFA